MASCLSFLGHFRLLLWERFARRRALLLSLLYVDVWSRKIVGFRVEHTVCGEHASELLQRPCAAQGVCARDLAVHQGNGAPMKGATLKAMMERLGLLASHRRPRPTRQDPLVQVLH